MKHRRTQLEVSGTKVYDVGMATGKEGDTLAVAARKGHGLGVSSMGAGGSADEFGAWSAAEFSFAWPTTH